MLCGVAQLRRQCQWVMERTMPTNIHHNTER